MPQTKEQRNAVQREYERRKRQEADPAWLKKQSKRTAAWRKAKYHSDPEFREKIKADTKAQKQAIREKVRDYLAGHPCVDCGEADPIVLQFDHPNNDGHMQTTPWQAGSWATAQQAIAVCEVRCANCHTRRHHRDQTGNRQHRSEAA